MNINDTQLHTKPTTLMREAITDFRTPRLIEEVRIQTELTTLNLYNVTDLIDLFLIHLQL